MGSRTARWLLRRAAPPNTPELKIGDGHLRQFRTNWRNDLQGLRWVKGICSSYIQIRLSSTFFAKIPSAKVSSSWVSIKSALSFLAGDRQATDSPSVRARSLPDSILTTPVSNSPYFIMVAFSARCFLEVSIFGSFSITPSNSHRTSANSICQKSRHGGLTFSPIHLIPMQIFREFRSPHVLSLYG